MGITRIRIGGFKSFRSLDLEMKPVNVLIGPNGGGKTNFVDFFRFLREAANEEISEPYLRRGGTAGVAFRGLKRFEGVLVFEIDFDALIVPIGIHGKYELSLRDYLGRELQIEREQFKGINRKGQPVSAMGRTTANRLTLFPTDIFFDAEENPKALGISLKAPTVEENRPLGGGNYFYWVGETVRNWASYDPIDTSPGSSVRIPDLARSGFNLRADGSNLTSVLHNLQNDPRGEKAFERIDNILRLVFPNFKRLSFPAEGGDGRLVLKWREGPFEQSDFSATFLSDGTLKFLCLLTTLLSPTPPPLIIIEEPELGLHPDLIRVVADLAKEASTRTQIVMTTHSPQLVSSLEPADVVVVEKDDGATQMQRLSDRSDLDAWLKKFSLGELWQMGEVGGRP